MFQDFQHFSNYPDLTYHKVFSKNKTPQIRKSFSDIFLYSVVIYLISANCKSNFRYVICCFCFFSYGCCRCCDHCSSGTDYYDAFKESCRRTVVICLNQMAPLPLPLPTKMRKQNKINGVLFTIMIGQKKSKRAGGGGRRKNANCTQKRVPSTSTKCDRSRIKWTKAVGIMEMAAVKFRIVIYSKKFAELIQKDRLSKWPKDLTKRPNFRCCSCLW